MEEVADEEKEKTDLTVGFLFGRMYM